VTINVTDNQTEKETFAVSPIECSSR
jgi:hypothetical protein